ncbi:uncharacterized protein LOC129598205 [Paramacrobiotus metropolitanus]|uniref:uncharacterized protein LOC129598205 n=1 Tax=Paramacrobiotus metropolitanus TaxID=2943436 RepID=UPI00244625B3|nr:uncharacterized protein LOC129598205 [Paramacrobiotus metropolitanus]
MVFLAIGPETLFGTLLTGKRTTRAKFLHDTRMVPIRRVEANRRYQQFFPPASFDHNPLSINIRQWKASHFRDWLLLYSVPCLDGILDPVYFANWCKLVDAVTILYSTPIRLDDLKRAGQKLHEFCLEFYTLFDMNEFGINFHGLLHLEEIVDLWGPLFCYDLFAFESQNGWMTRHSHSTHNVTRSVMKNLLGAQIIRKQAADIRLPNERSLLRLVQGQRLKDGIEGKGWCSWSALSRSMTVELPQNHPCHGHEKFSLKTAIIDGISVWTEHYRKPKRTLGRYFLLTDTRTGEKGYTQVLDLLYCKTCNDLTYVGYHLKPQFKEPNIVELSLSGNANIMLSASHIGLQECVSRKLQDACVQIILVEKSRYSS